MTLEDADDAESLPGLTGERCPVLRAEVEAFIQVDIGGGVAQTGPVREASEAALWVLS